MLLLSSGKQSGWCAPRASSGLKKKRTGYTAHKQLRCNGLQANERMQQMDRAAKKAPASQA